MMFIVQLKTAALITAACVVVAGSGVIVAKEVLTPSATPATTQAEQKSPQPATATNAAATIAWGEAVNGLRLSLHWNTNEYKGTIGSIPGYVLKWENVGKEPMTLVRNGRWDWVEGVCRLFVKGPDGKVLPARSDVEMQDTRALPKANIIGPGQVAEEVFNPWEFVRAPNGNGDYAMWVEFALEERLTGVRGEVSVPHWSGRLRSNEIRIKDALSAVLIANKGTYVLDPKYAGEVFRKDVQERLKDMGRELPTAQTVDFTLRITNTSDKAITLRVGGDESRTELTVEGKVIRLSSRSARGDESRTELTVEGKGAVNVQPRVAIDYRMGKPTTIEPGKSIDVPVTSLASGERGITRKSYFTEPGEYTLGAKFIAASVDDRRWELTTPPVKFTVVAGKMTAGKPVDGEHRARNLKANVERFRICLDPELSKVEKPFYSLDARMNAPQKKEGFDGSADLTREQAIRIIAHLGRDGFLAAAKAWDMRVNTPLRFKTEGYVIMVYGMDENTLLYEELGWDAAMLKRLDGLRMVLDGDAAAGMDRLLQRMSGLRAEWEKADTKTGQTPTLTPEVR